MVRVLGLFEVPREGRGNTVLGVPTRPYAYGAQYLVDANTELVRVNPARNRLHVKARDVIEHRTGVKVDLTVRSVPALWRCDAVFAFLEPQVVLASELRQRGFPLFRDKPVVVISCWWAEELDSEGDEARRRILRIISGVDRLVVFSRNQVEIFRRHGVPPEKIVPVGFSIDALWCSPDPSVAKVRDVVAIGFDRGRDYGTLVQAARLLPEFQFEIYTQPGRLDPGDVPPNVSLCTPVHGDEYVRTLREARVVAVPTHELAYPTGQSVLLEAFGVGACVVATKTEALGEYFVDGVHALGAEVEDASSMAQALGRALRDPQLRAELGQAARRWVVEHYAYPGMWVEIRALIHDLVAARSTE